MKYLNWQALLGLSLIVLSVIFYVIHFLIFRDSHHIFIFLMGDVAFVFTEVLLVTLIIHRLLDVREKKARLEKMNMVIGVFFSETGTKLLAYLSCFDDQLDQIRKELIVDTRWSNTEFARVSNHLKNYKYHIDLERSHIEDIRTFLSDQRNFLLRLLENPNILEHESFTELLRAVFHLTEELAGREDLHHLPDADHMHLTADTKRVYILLVHEWLDYMKHLKSNYPYLFSFAMRTNPFDQDACLIIPS